MNAALLSLLLAAAPPAADRLSPQTQQDLRTLGLKTPIDVEDLLKRVRYQTLTEKDRAQSEEKIELLASKHFRNRDRAMRDLMFSNPGVDPLLRRRLGDADAETRRRIEQMLRYPRGRWAPEKAEATLRLLREFRPEGTVESLLDFLPYADDVWIAQEAAVTLRALGVSSERIAAKAAQLPFEGDWIAETSPAEQARRAARRFFASLAGQDHDDLRRLCGLPFLVGILALESDGELEEVFGHAAEGYKLQGKLLELRFGEVVRGETWAPSLSESESLAFRRLSADCLRVVALRMVVDAKREEHGSVLIELRRDGPRVVGLVNGK